MENRIAFLYASINDTQSTIRAIDMKAGFIFLLLFSPVVYLEKGKTIFLLFQHTSEPLKLLTIVAVFLWFLSVYLLFMSVAAIDNPSKHVNDKSVTGVFFGGGLFELNALDLFCNMRNTVTHSIDKEVGLLPANDIELVRELVFEKIKLTYIRTVKTRRSAVCYYMTLGWVSASSLLYVLLGDTTWH